MSADGQSVATLVQQLKVAEVNPGPRELGALGGLGD